MSYITSELNFFLKFGMGGGGYNTGLLFWPANLTLIAEGNICVEF